MSESMLIAYRHDAHKFTGQSHDDAPVMVDGIVVNQSVPRGADDDAAALSRPRQTGTQTVATHCDHHRLSLLTGETVFGSRGHSSATVECDVRDLLVVESAETAHKRWLASDVAAAFNESVYHPYTSLKYHTLLVAALLDNYRAGHGFADLRLVVDSAADGLQNFFEATVELMKVMARACGHDSLAGFERRDLTTWKKDIADLTGVEYAGIGKDG